MAFTKTDQVRICTLSVAGMVLEHGEEAVAEALETAGALVLEHLEFDSGNSASRSSGRSGRSSGRGSSSRSGSRGGKGRGGGRNADWRNDPATDKQIEKAIELGALEDGYSESDLEGMTKGAISDLIDELN